MNDIYLRAKNLALRYRVPDESNMSLKKTIVRNIIGGRVEGGNIVALDNISLDLKAGDSLALLGHNGSGKTSLLRCLAGIMQPQNGTIETSGNLEVFIDPAAGLDFECTGRRNIFLLGYARGLSKEFITGILDDVIAFSELENFIDLPVRTYSQGMISRLSFSFALMLRPAILLVDEGLGTGDAAFIEKARQKMLEMVDAADIFVMSTHSREMAETYCSTYITLEHGRIIENGQFGD